MIEEILNASNMQMAYKQVKRNNGSAGIDGMSMTQLSVYLKKNWESISCKARNQEYQPQAILGVEIPKSNGKTRLLGIPTLTERLLQQAVNQVLSPIFEPDFQENSYGFRPGRNAHQAVKKAQQNINEGYQYILDIDLRNFFDEVRHELLLELIYCKVKCPQTLRLIRKWLKAPMLLNGKLIMRKQGIPQGSPLSPLLSNIVLNELDKELEKRGPRYVRYADDFSIYLKSEKSARRVGNSIYLFLEQKLKLPVKWDKKAGFIYNIGIQICFDL
jgi:RNA-directed DNA polymerase